MAKTRQSSSKPAAEMTCRCGKSVKLRDTAAHSKQCDKERRTKERAAERAAKESREQAAQAKAK